MKKVTIIGAVIFALMSAAPALAEANIEASPANWRIQNYVPNTVVAFFTGSSCSGGSLGFAANATVDDRNRFFSMVLTAKATGKVIGVYYETVSGSCNITSFYMVN